MPIPIQDEPESTIGRKPPHNPEETKERPPARPGEGGHREAAGEGEGEPDPEIRDRERGEPPTKGSSP